MSFLALAYDCLKYICLLTRNDEKNLRNRTVSSVSKIIRQLLRFYYGLELAEYSN